MKSSDEIKTLVPTTLGTLAALAVDGGVGIVLGGLITGLASLHSQRANELIEQTFNRLDIEKLDKSFLESEAFLEVFERSVEIVTKTASDKKRKLVADYLSGVIGTSVINDIHGQLLEDLNMLQEFHLQVLATLPDKVGAQVQKSEQLIDMPDYIFEKAISDLERFGFIRFNHISVFSGGIDSRNITEYSVKFKKTFEPQ